MVNKAQADLIFKAKGQGFSELNQQIQKLGKTTKKVTTSVQQFNKAGKTVTVTTKRVGKQVKSTTTNIKNMRKEFNFAWLSVMFGGMAIQKAFRGMFDAGFKTFRDLAGETNPLNQAMSRLSAETTLLKFTLGEALAGRLQELMPTIISIVEKVVEWIEANPKLAANFVMIGLAVGTLLSFLGQFFLFIQGIKMLAVVSKGLTAVWAVLKYGSLILWAALKFVVSIIGILSKAMLALLANPVVLLIAGIILLVGFLIYLGAKMGGVGEFFKAVWRGMLTVVMLSISGILRLVEALIGGLAALGRAVGADGMAAGLERANNAIKGFRYGLEDSLVAKIEGVQMQNGTLETANPFGPMTGGSSGATTNINIDGSTLQGVDQTMSIQDLIAEIQRQTGATQGV